MKKRTGLLEVCVDSYAGLMAAHEGGADRVELCSALGEGGLTPTAGFMQAAAELELPCYAMIRPRSGDFCYSPEEVEIMLRDVASVRGFGLAGIVIGAETPERGLDLPTLRKLVAAASGLGITLHRVIDCVDNQYLALDQAIELGIQRVLTSGGAASAKSGTARIRGLVKHADEKISVMPGAGINAGNVHEIVAQTGASEIHASCREHVAGRSGHLFSEAGRPETQTGLVRDLKAALMAVGTAKI